MALSSFAMTRRSAGRSPDRYPPKLPLHRVLIFSRRGSRSCHFTLNNVAGALQPPGRLRGRPAARFDGSAEPQALIALQPVRRIETSVTESPFAVLFRFS